MQSLISIKSFLESLFRDNKSYNVVTQTTVPSSKPTRYWMGVMIPALDVFHKDAVAYISYGISMRCCESSQASNLEMKLTNKIFKKVVLNISHNFQHLSLVQRLDFFY